MPNTWKIWLQDVVVIAGPFEHHSNLLPWREAADTVISVGRS
jgi:selenocysteine lyase/cysteine desulfurase